MSGDRKYDGFKTIYKQKGWYKVHTHTHYQNNEPVNYSVCNIWIFSGLKISEHLYQRH